MAGNSESHCTCQHLSIAEEWYYCIMALIIHSMHNPSFTTEWLFLSLGRWYCHDNELHPAWYIFFYHVDWSVVLCASKCSLPSVFWVTIWYLSDFYRARGSFYMARSCLFLVLVLADYLFIYSYNAITLNFLSIWFTKFHGGGTY